MKSFIILAFILGIGFYFYSWTFLITLLVISFLIFFHELGHFLTAKSLGVKVEIFSIGFGKALLEREFKGTRYRLSALPFGGFVKLKGQDDLKPSLEVYEKDSYTCLKPLQKIYILFAGPFFNIFLAFLLFIIIGFLGISKPAPIIAGFSDESLAQSAGLKINDKILAINGTKISSFDEIAPLINADKLRILIERAGQKLEFIVPTYTGVALNDFGQSISKPLLGVRGSSQRVLVYHTGLDNLNYALKESANTATLIFKGIVKLLVGDIEAKNLGGVISIVDITSKASAMSLSTLLFITALISINLGVLNLLPVPMLDGGHILFNLYELIFRRKVPPKAFEYLSYGGMALLLSLMIFATYNDIVRFSQQ